jgi:ribosomal protein S18 acetylase RimI-like enzyme
MKLNAIEKSAHLFHLIIDENYRNKGYAKKLVKHVEQKLTDKEKFNRLSLNCVKKNQSALALYQSLGFSIVKVKRHIKMVKDLK